MKLAETKTTASAQHLSKSEGQQQPFFQREKAGSALDIGEPSFFSPNGSVGLQPRPFFGKRTVQTQLHIGQPGDKYEREADRTADQVVQRLAQNKNGYGNGNKQPIANSQSGLQRKPIFESQAAPEVQAKSVNGHTLHPPQIQRKCDACEPEQDLQKMEEPGEEEALQQKPIFDSAAPPPEEADEGGVQRKGTRGAGSEVLTPNCTTCAAKHDEAVQRQESTDGTTTPPDRLTGQLDGSKGGGAPLPEDTRTQMEGAFGTDFSNVRIHTGSGAEQMSQSVRAQAFTHGSDIYFNSGKYNPSSADGQQLLAHELTHTVQQGEALQRKALSNTPIQKAPVTEALTPATSEVVDISSGQFLPSEKVKTEIKQAGSAGLDVRVIVPGISREGKIKIRIDSNGSYDAVHGQKGYMPVLNPWATQMGGLYLRFTVKNNAVTGGFVSPAQKGGNPNDWIKKIKENAALLGGLGLKIGKLPNLVNEFNANSFRLGFTDGNIEVGGFIEAKFSFSLENGAKPKIDAIADVKVKGVAEGQLKLDNTKETLTGEVTLAVAFKDFTGNVLVKYNEDGSIDIHGKATYNANKLSGEIDLVSTDVQSANNFAKDAIKAAGGLNNVQNATPPNAAPAPKEGKKDRALAAVGQLQFNLTQWFAGTVSVIVDGKGDVTVIGKIAPPAEIELFGQKDYDKELVSLQVEAGYGIPLVGTIGVFAGVSLSAVAYIGPAKLYQIEISGTYSTDPEVQKSIQIAGSINISAYAGLRLRAEGGAKLTVISHDLKLGVGVNADVGVKAYADARPTIGYREPGEFYISGTAEMVAQPMLGLSGDFFIELDAPWWSPIDDDKWVWPIGSKEWPLSDPIGLSATMKDYVLGSGTAPEIEFKKPEFDPSKFMTKMVDKQLPEKTGDAKGGQAGFKEDGSVAKPEVPDPNAEEKDKKADGAELKAGKAPSELKEQPKKPQPDPKAQQEAALLFQNGGKKLETIKGPLSKGDLSKELHAIEQSVPGIKYSSTLDGEKWVVTASAKGVDNPKAFKVSAIVTEEEKKEGGKGDRKDDIIAALREIDTEAEHELDEGAVNQDEAEAIKNKVNRDHATVIEISSVKDGGETWDFEYVQLAKTGTKKEPKKKEPKVIEEADNPEPVTTVDSLPRWVHDPALSKEENVRNNIDRMRTLGRTAHKEVQTRWADMGFVEQYISPASRPDGVKIDGEQISIRELKPDTNNGKRTGHTQLNRYVEDVKKSKKEKHKDIKSIVRRLSLWRPTKSFNSDEVEAVDSETQK